MSSLTGVDLERRRKQIERSATFGLLLICVALVGPFTDITNIKVLSVYRWIYGAGAIIYLIARAVDVSDPEESMRMRRLRRMEFWAGISFGIALFFWFYDQYHLGDGVGILAVLRNTIMFTLVGAVIQIIASWLIFSQNKKDFKEKQ